MIGISWYFGFEIEPEERVKLLKKYGFDCVITNADKKFNKQNGTIKNQIKLFNKYEIKLSSLHMRYNSVDLPHFWLDDKCGKMLEKNLIRDVKLAHKYKFSCVVVHLRARKYTKIGEERLKRVLKICTKLNVDLAIENLCNNYEVFEKVFKNINHRNLKFCYDAGHHNIWMKEIDFLEKYGDKLIALHLHSNKGTYDNHTLSKYGNIDWDKIAEKLAKLPRVNLDYELLMVYKPKNITAERVLEECMKEAKFLQDRIAYYRNAK